MKREFSRSKLALPSLLCLCILGSADAANAQQSATHSEPAGSRALPDSDWVRLEPVALTIGADWDDDLAWQTSALAEIEFTPDSPLLASPSEVTQKEWFGGLGTHHSYYSECPHCPVVNVTVDEIVVFANRASLLAGLTPCYSLPPCAGELPWRPTEGYRRADGLSCSGEPELVAECNGYRLPTDQEWEWMARQSAPDSSECIQSLVDGPYEACAYPVERGLGLSGFTSNSAELVWGDATTSAWDETRHQMIRGSLRAVGTEDPMTEVLLTRVRWLARQRDDSVGFRLVRNLPNPEVVEVPVGIMVWRASDDEFTTTVLRPNRRSVRLDGLYVAAESGLWNWRTRTLEITLTNQRCYDEQYDRDPAMRDYTECESVRDVDDSAFLPVNEAASAIGAFGLRELPHPRSEDWNSWQRYGPHEEPLWSVPGGVAVQVGAWMDGGGAHGWGVSNTVVVDPDAGASTNFENLVSPTEAVRLQEQCVDECVFCAREREEYENNSGGSLNSVRFQLDCGSREQGDERPRVVGSFRRASSYVNNCSRDSDYQEAHLVLETDELPETVREHWPPPPEVIAAVCDGQPSGTRVEHFGWTTWAGSARELDQLLEEQR